MNLSSLSLALAAFTFVSAPSVAAAQSFKDVPRTHPAHAAVEFLKSQNILQGYSDGTFRPARQVQRAEALKILVSTKLSASDVSQYTTTGFSDVPVGSWFLPYVEAGVKKLGIIDGPPKATAFRPDKPVTRAEFFKMLFKSQGIGMDGVADLNLPLSNDVSNTAEWHYPFMRYALASSLIQIDTKGNLLPGQPVTREEAALFMYRLAMYNAGKRTQALLSVEETEIANVYKSIDSRDVAQAEQAAARALVAARGAYLTRPNDPVARGALKIAEAVNVMAKAYTAGSMQKFDESVTLSKEAWALADRARTFTPKVNEYANAVQALSKTMADRARSQK